MDKPGDSNTGVKISRYCPCAAVLPLPQLLCFQGRSLQRKKFICLKNIIDIQTLTWFRLSKLIQGSGGPKRVCLWFGNGAGGVDRQAFFYRYALEWDNFTGPVCNLLFENDLKRSEEKISRHKAVPCFAQIWARKGRESVICAWRFLCIPWDFCGKTKWLFSIQLREKCSKQKLILPLNGLGDRAAVYMCMSWMHLQTFNMFPILVVKIFPWESLCFQRCLPWSPFRWRS